jgi:hypothetical protein
MAESHRILEPSLLSDLETVPASCDIESNQQVTSGSRARQVTLVLLQPLANDNVLAACRDPPSRSIHKEDGSVCGMSNHEYLDLRPLGIIWRRAVAGVAPISRLTFELTLPQNVENTDSFTKVYWDTALPRQGGLVVLAQRIMTLVITLATATRIRAKGDVQFEVLYDRAEGISLKAMSGLEEQLQAIAQYKPPKQDEDCHDQDVAENPQASA